MGDIKVCAFVDAPALNPSVTIGESTITFETELHSGEYIEYYPETGKAYHYYYNGTNQIYTKPIDVDGSVTVPEGDFTYTYGAENSATSTAPLRAEVVIGLRDLDNVIENEQTVNAPSIPHDTNYVEIRNP